MSKTDIFNEEHLESKQEIENKYKKFIYYQDFEELKTQILENYTKNLSKFDPKKIGLIK